MTFRFNLNNANLSAGVTETAATSYTPGADLADGAHTLYVQERDDAGNWSTSGSFTITVDTTAPNAPIPTGDSITNNPRPTWSWTAQGGGNGTFRFKLNNADLSAGATETAATSYTPGADLTDGAHTLYVKERDVAGNWSTSGSFTINVDTTAPSISNISSSTGNGTYGIGDVINIEVSFSEAVVFSNSNSTLTLNNSATAIFDAIVNATVVRYSYTISAGEDIPVLTVNSVNVNSDIIEDSAGNALISTLPAGNNLDDNNDIGIETPNYPEPGAVGVMTSNDLTHNSVTLNWTKATDSVTTQANLKYLVYQSTANNISGTETVAVIESNGTLLNAGGSLDIESFAATGLDDSKVYYFNVVVENGAGYKSAYAGVSITTVDSTPPNVGAFQTETNITSTGFTLHWEAGADNLTSASNLSYYLCSGPDLASINTTANCEGAFMEMNWSDAATSFVISGKDPDTTYWFNVIVKDEAENKAIYEGAQVATLPLPNLELSVKGENPGIFAATKGGNNGNTLLWTIRNVGSDVADGSFSVSLAGNDPGAFIYGNNCLANFPSGETCAVTVKFSPPAGAQNLFNAELVLQANSGIVPIPLQGTANDITMFSVIAPNELHFATGGVFSHKAGINDGLIPGSFRSVRIVNDTGVDINGFSPSLVGIDCPAITISNDEKFGADTGCGENIAAGDSCFITLALDVTSTVSQSCNLQFAATSIHNTQLPPAVPISATYVNVQNLGMTTQALSFGSVEPGQVSPTLDFHLCRPNTGGAASILDSHFTTPDAAFSMVASNCVPGQFTQGQCCSNSYQFSPTSGHSGFYHDRITAQVNSGPVFVVNLEGYVDSGPEIIVSQSHLDFGYVSTGDATQKAYRQVEIENIGTRDLNGLSLNFTASSGVFTYETVLSSCGSTLAKGQSCVAVISYHWSFENNDIGVAMDIVDDTDFVFSSIILDARTRNIDPSESYLVISSIDPMVDNCDAYNPCWYSFPSNDGTMEELMIFTISNVGPSDTSGFGFQFDGSPDASFSGNVCMDLGSDYVFCWSDAASESCHLLAGELASGESCQITVNFQAKSTDDGGTPYSAGLEWNSSNSPAGTLRLDLQGMRSP